MSLARKQDNVSIYKLGSWSSDYGGTVVIFYHPTYPYRGAGIDKPLIVTFSMPFEVLRELWLCSYKAKKERGEEVGLVL